jgi:hypothetical protein
MIAPEIRAPNKEERAVPLRRGRKEKEVNILITQRAEVIPRAGNITRLGISIVSKSMKEMRRRIERKKREEKSFGETP